MFKSRIARRILKSLAILMALGVLGLVGVIASLWLGHRFATTLPAPTGPFAVGREIFDWVDDQTNDPAAPTPGTKRELLVWIWYPTDPDQPAATADDYLPARARVAVERHRGNLVSNWLTRDLARVRCHSLHNAQVSPQQAAYPVVLFRGGASLEVWNYTTLAEDLASHGYIVVGIDASYRSILVNFPDSREVTRSPENNPELYEGQPQAPGLLKLLSAWTSDMSYVLDRLEQLNAADPSGKFTGRIDLSRIGAFGHSFGGAQSIEFCKDDPRCKAALDIDGLLLGNVVQTGVHCPVMFLLSEQDTSNPEGHQVMADIQSVYNTAPQDKRMIAQITGANHFTFTDDGALLKSPIFRGLLRLFGKLGISGQRQLAATTYAVHTFFDTQLKSQDNTSPAIPLPSIPELTVLSSH